MRNAGYQAGHHDTCLRGTREAVLDWIVRWTEDPPDRYVFWLNGLAGTGKSTIAQTFSEMVARNGTLGASFFCSRDYLDRKELKNIFPTLAYQLACRYPSFRAQIIRAIRQDPTIAQSSLLSQLKDLIIDPLSSTDISCVIVVDALDECVDDQPASAILSVLGRYVKQVPLVKFFITGRPEPRIRTGFRLPLLEPLTQVFLLHQVELSSVDEDIRLYLQEKLSAIARRRSDSDLSNAWPCEEDLATLTRKSSGLFIFASTLVRFIGSEYHEPDERLRLIVTLPDSTIHEGRTGIDPLYTQVLVHAFSDIEETTVFANLRKVLGAVVLAFNPLSRVQISQILGISPSLIATTLRHLHSVLLVPTEDSKEIRVFHKSFPDFLQDCGRCKDSKFFVDPSAQHGDMALGCLELMKKLKSNPCDLPNFVMNRDAVDLPSLLADKVGSAMRYACGYWAMHVRSSPTTDDYAIQLIGSATEFFQDNVIPWIEVLSLENRLESVIHSIYNLFEWLGAVRTELLSIIELEPLICKAQVDAPTSDLRSLAQDCLRFTMYFFPAIEQSVPHVYHSALPLSPRSSILSSTTHRETVVKEFYGCPDTWGTVVRTIKASSSHFTCMTTFSHWIAAACDDGTVGVYDSVTGVLRLPLSPPDLVQAIRGTPDGSMLFCAHRGPSITAWDIQTGGLIHTFTLECRVGDIAICLSGRYFACGLSNGSVKTWEVASKMEIATFGSGSLITHLCWLEPGEQLVVVDEATVRVWDVVTRKVLRRFTVTGSVCGVIYAQKLNKFAIVAASEAESIVTVVDSRTGVSFADRTPRRISCIAFSQITKELVCGVDTPGLELFNIWVGGWKRFDHPVAVTSVSTLSNGTVVADVAGSGIQLLDLDQGPPTSQQSTLPALTVDVLDEGRITTVLSTARDQIVLLEPVTMSQLLNIPVRKTHSIPTDRTAVLCASHEHRIAAYSFEEGAKKYLQLWVFGNELQEWAVETDELSLMGGISLSGARLVTLSEVGALIHIHIRDTRNGRITGYLLGISWLPHPLGIKFESEDQFYFQYNAHHIPFLISSTASGAHGHSITRHRQRPFVGRPQRRYDVDHALEWVVGFSRRICWIPPWYISGSVQHGYCWTGDMLIMAGQDGVLRKLTFRDSLETNFEGYDGCTYVRASFS